MNIDDKITSPLKNKGADAFLSPQIMLYLIFNENE